MTALYNHLCAAPGCDQWGSRGFAVGRDRPMVWYCQQHKHLGEARTGLVEPGAAPSPKACVPGSQGRLL
ncbi:hypothetical protein IP70_15735 [alpha proteobacterium AAP38]|nr:hypothetical protein IP70_15735 [alpha proteobacterium AAP38]